MHQFNEDSYALFPQSPVIVEIPHFGSMRGKERELIVLRSDNGDTWKEHQSDTRPEDLTELLSGMDEGNRKVIWCGPHFINNRWAFLCGVCMFCMGFWMH